MPTTSTIAYTKTDEAPALATHSLLPILRAFTHSSGIDYELKDISQPAVSLPISLIAQHQSSKSGCLAELGELATRSEANIIKLPNISASIPQQDAIMELQSKGYTFLISLPLPRLKRKRHSFHLCEGFGFSRQSGFARGKLWSQGSQTG